MNSTMWAGAGQIVDGPGGTPVSRAGGPSGLPRCALAKARNATILATQLPAARDPGRADHVGDSLALSRIAAEAEEGRSSSAASTHGRDRQDPEPGEDRADPGRAGRLLARRLDHRRTAPGVEGRAPRRTGGVLRQHTAEVKGLTDICCTSSNAVDVVASIDPDREVGSLPDQFSAPTSAGDRPREHAHLGGGVPRARRHQR